MTQQPHINWFSPLPPLRTDIGHYTMRIVRQLARQAHVTLWTDQKSWDPEIEKVARVRHFDLNAIDFPALNRGDVNIYNIGNNSDFHLGIWKLSCQMPGIVILHDLVLQDIFRGYFTDKINAPQAYCDVMAALYGRTAGEAAHQFVFEGVGTPQALAAHYPLVELCLHGALAAICHTEKGAREIQDRAGLPGTCLPLPFQVSPLERSGPFWSPGTDRPIRLVQFGYMAPNRRLYEILDVLAALPEKNLFQFDIFGKLWDSADLQGKLKELDLTEQVTFHGFVEESVLEDTLNSADLAFNLRQPTMGEASGSLLRIWNHGLPAMVSNDGWYADLPDDTVLKIGLDTEAQDIAHALKSIVRGDSSLEKISSTGRAFFEQEHGVDQFCTHLLDLIPNVPELLVRKAMINATREAVRTTADIFDQTNSQNGVTSISEAALSMWPTDAKTGTLS